MDRSMHKLLSLPILDTMFRDALRSANFDHLEFVLALSDGPRVECLENTLHMISACEDGELLAAQLTDRVEMLRVLFLMVQSTKGSGVAEMATDLGFGQASCSTPGPVVRQVPPQNKLVSILPFSKKARISVGQERLAL